MNDHNRELMKRIMDDPDRFAALLVSLTGQVMALRCDQHRENGDGDRCEPGELSNDLYRELSSRAEGVIR